MRKRLLIIAAMIAGVSPAFAQAGGAGISCQQFTTMGAGGQAAVANQLQGNATPTAPAGPTTPVQPVQPQQRPNVSALSTACQANPNQSVGQALQQTNPNGT